MPTTEMEPEVESPEPTAEQPAKPPPDVQQIIASSGAPDPVKADAWDAFHSSNNPADFQSKFQSLRLPDETKAALWDAKFPQPKMAGPIPQSVLQNARQNIATQNMQAADEDAQNPNPLLKPIQPGEDARAAIGRQAMGTAYGLVKGTAHLFAPPETPDEEALAGSSQYGQGSLAFKRAFVDPSVEEFEHGASKLGAIPILGPTAAQMGRDAGSGNVVGAATNAAILAEMTPAIAKGIVAAPGVVRAGAEGFAARRAARIADQNYKATAADFQRANPPTKQNPYSPADYKVFREHVEPLSTPDSPIKTTPDAIAAADKAVQSIEAKVREAIAHNPQDVISTDALAKAEAKLKANPRSDFTEGMKDLDPYGLDEPKTLSKLDDIRRQLNAENSSLLEKNGYKQATARATDPGFAARETAAATIRDAIYDHLADERGIEGVRDLRRAEGSVIKVRNNLKANEFNGDSFINSGTTPGVARLAAENVAKYGPAIAGAGIGESIGSAVGAPVVGGVAGYATGRAIGSKLAKTIAPEALTRDALIERSFSKNVAAPPEFPTLPPRPEIAGLLGPSEVRTAPPPTLDNPVPPARQPIPSAIPMPPVGEAGTRLSPQGVPEVVPGSGNVTLGQPAVTAVSELAERIQKGGGVPTAEFTDEGIRSFASIPPGVSLKPLVDQGVLVRTPRGGYRLGAPEVGATAQPVTNRPVQPFAAPAPPELVGSPQPAPGRSNTIQPGVNPPSGAMPQLPAGPQPMPTGPRFGPEQVPLTTSGNPLDSGTAQPGFIRATNQIDPRAAAQDFMNQVRTAPAPQQLPGFGLAQSMNRVRIGDRFVFEGKVYIKRGLGKAVLAKTVKPLVEPGEPMEHFPEEPETP